MLNRTQRSAIWLGCCSFVLLLPLDAAACEKDYSSRLTNTRVVDGEITRRVLELQVPAATASRAPLWLPGRTELALSPDDAVKVLLRWLDENSDTADEQAIKGMRVAGCPDEDGFRMYLFDLYPGDDVAVLFDRTVVPHVELEHEEVQGTGD